MLDGISTMPFDEEVSGSAVRRNNELSIETYGIMKYSLGWFVVWSACEKSCVENLSSVITFSARRGIFSSLVGYGTASHLARIMTGRQFCARRSFRWDGRETRADYLIMPDAVYLGVQKETKEAAWRNVLAIPDLYCDAPRRERRRPPENCQTEKSTVAFFLDISGASQLRRLSNWHAGITADAATSSSPPLNSSFLPANVVSSRDTISPLRY